MKYNEFLLSDEKEITEFDFQERKKLVEEFSNMPEEFFSKLRHFQPQVGCLNACKICSKFAGTTTEYWTETRSTVGYSRFNEELNEMHRKINSPELLEALGGVRLSFTPYEVGWECPKGKQEYSKTDYINDMANFLKIYKPYYEMVGSGSRDMCVEIRYKPLVNLAEVYNTTVLGHMVYSIRWIYIRK